MSLPADQDHLLNAAFQIIDSSVDSEAIFEEACSLSKRIRLQCDRSQSADLDISVNNFLSVTCQELQRRSRYSREDVQPIPTFARQIIELSQSCSQRRSPLLTPDARDKFEAILMLLKLKTEDFWYDSSLFQSIVIRYNLPLEVLWNLQMIGAISLDSYFSCKLSEDSSFVEMFSSEMLACCQGSFDSFSSRLKILTGLAGYFIKKAFGEEKTTLKRSFIHLLDSILEGILGLKLSADEMKVLALPSDFLNYQEILPRDTVKRFSLHALSYILSCKADGDEMDILHENLCEKSIRCSRMSEFGFSDVLKSCSDWKSVQVHGAVQELCRQLFLPLSCEVVAGALLQSFDQLKVNCTLTMIFLVALYSTFQEAARVMNGHIKLKLSEGLDNSDAAKLSAAVLLVRQSAVAGGDDVPSYSSWFETTFGDSSNSLASSRSTFTSLMRFLSSLVPSESAECLKVHILKRPAIPVKCRTLYTDYVALAKTRLEDLKIPLHDLSKGIYNNSSLGTDGSIKKTGTNQAEEDVERTVKAFAETGKLPTAIIEASIFRKPYFIGKFLPALLTPRHLPDVPDHRMKLISEMHNAGKIASAVYNNYVQECEKEKQALLQGVFDVDDDDYELEEMTLPPLRQLSSKLDNYKKLVSTGNQDKVAGCLMQVVEKVRSCLPTASSEESSCDGSVVVDLLLPSHDDVFMQIVSETMGRISSLISHWNTLEVRNDRVRCLVAVNRLITSLCVEVSNLKTAFYLYILLHLDSEVDQFTSIVTTAATVCTCLMTSPSPLNVKHKGHDHVPVQKSYKNILKAVVECLSLNIKSNLEYMLRFWLDYVAAACDLQDAKDEEAQELGVIEVDPQLCAETHLLPGHFVKQIDLLCRRYEFVKRRQQEVRFKVLNSVPARMNSVLSDRRWKVLCMEHQYTLSDWIQFELAVRPQEDLLSSTERAEFFWEMGKFFGDKPDQATGSAVFCSEVLKILAVHLAKTSRGIHTVGDSIPDNFMCFVPLLTKHLVRLPSSDVASKSWLAGTLESAAELPCKDYLLRLAIELPPHILFCNSVSERVCSRHVDSAMFVLGHFITSGANQGGYLSQKTTIFMAQAVIWVQQTAQCKSELERFLTHPIALTSVLVHKKILEEQGLFWDLGDEWTSRLTMALQWAQSFVELGEGCVAQKPIDAWQQAAALFSVLLYREHDVVLKDHVVTSENVMLCFLELVMSRLTSQSLFSYSGSCLGHVLVRVVTQIISAKGEFLMQLLDTCDPNLCELRQSVGLVKHPGATFWRDFHILRLAAQIPVHTILRGICRNVTLAVVNAYVRVLQYTYDNVIEHDKCLDEMGHISVWIKRMVDHTKGDHLQEINTPEAEVCEADLLLFRYMEEKKKGLV